MFPFFYETWVAINFDWDGLGDIKHLNNQIDLVVARDIPDYTPDFDGGGYYPKHMETIRIIGEVLEELESTGYITIIDLETICDNLGSDYVYNEFDH